METWYEYAILWDNPQDMGSSITFVGNDKQYARTVLAACMFATGKVQERKITRGEWEDAAE